MARVSSGTTPLVFTLDGTLAVGLLTGSSPADLVGNTANNTLTGNGAANTIDGGDGNDTINGDAGADIVNGGAGNDTINTGAASDTANGGDGDDVILGDSGADTLTGDAGNDTMTGGSQNDTINGGASGADVDTARFTGNLGTISGSATLSVTSSDSAEGTDAVSNVEIIDYADADVVIVGRAGSSIADLNAALAAYTGSQKFWGDLTINSSTSFSTQAEFAAIYARLVSGGSTIAVDMSGMSASQIAAVNANYATASASLTNAPITIKRGDPLVAVGQAPTIQTAIDAATAGDTVVVPAGTFYERITISKALTVNGAKANQAVAARAAAFTAGRADPTVESILMPPTVNTSSASGNLVRIAASNVTFDGFTVDGSNPALTGGTTVNGVATHARDGIANGQDSGNSWETQNLAVRNNIVQNMSRRGMTLNGMQDGWSGSLSAGVVRGNLVRNFAGRGISIAWNAFIDVKDNVVSVDSNLVDGGLGIGFFSFSGSSGGSCEISGNTVTVNAAGNVGFISNNMAVGGTGSVITVRNNTVNAGSSVAAADGATAFIMREHYSGLTVAFTDNVVGASGGTFARGFHFWSIPASTVTATVSGGSVSRSAVGVQLAAVDFDWGAANGSTGQQNAVSVSNITINATEVGVLANGSPLGIPGVTYSDTVIVPVRVNVSGVLCSSPTHFKVVGSNPGGHMASMSFGMGNTATGGTDGVVVDGPRLKSSPARFRTSPSAASRATTSSSSRARATSTPPPPPSAARPAPRRYREGPPGATPSGGTGEGARALADPGGG